MKGNPINRTQPPHVLSPILCKTGLICLMFVLISCGHVHTSENQSPIRVHFDDTPYSMDAFQLMKAKRLFYGLIPLDLGTRACADCHYASYIDTLNWNPSAFAIAGSFSGRNAEELLQTVNAPPGKVLAEAHQGYNISREQAVLLQAYLEELHQHPYPERKRVITRLFLFLLANLLGLYALLDLLWLRRIPYRAVHLAILLGVTVYLLHTLIIEGINIGRQQGYAPEQALKFSHKIHSGDNKMDCQYCHNLAEQSKVAGVPEAGLCMNCHLLIVEGTRSGKFEIRKISAALETQTPIAWVKVHNLPDYVFFSHAQHVGVGKLNCAECHGPVETMDVVKQQESLSMGWCLNCHRTRAVDSGNAYYQHDSSFIKAIQNERLDSVQVAAMGGTDCMKCHY